jgi:hypothetical protein
MRKPPVRSLPVRNAIFNLAVLACAAMVTAAPRRVHAEEPPRQVEVVLVGALGRDATLPARIVTWFDPHRFQVAFRMVEVLDVRSVLAPKHGEPTRVWITLPAREKARFYFSSASTKEASTVYLMRELRLDHAVDELAAERIAQVCFLSTVALVEGQAETRKAELEQSLRDDASVGAPSRAINEANGVAPEAQASGSSGTERPEPAGHSPRDRERPSKREGIEGTNESVLAFGVGYGMSFRGDEGIGHGPRARAETRFPPIGFALIVQGYLPNTAEFERLALRLYGASFVSGIEYRWARRQSAFALYLGPGLDLIHYVPEGVDSNVRAGSSATEGRPKIAVGARYEVGPAPVRIAVTGELGIALTRTHYDLVEATDRQEVARPWPLIPTLGLEAQF